MIDGSLPLLYAGLRVLILLALGYLATIVISRMIRSIRGYVVRAMMARGGLLESEVEKRANTAATFARRTILALLWVTVVITSLHQLGFKVDALLAGAGVSAGILGVAVGFGAQTFIKDVIAGLFILIENQIRVGDVAVLNGVSGVVEEITFRTIILRSENGATNVFPNGSITTLANQTHGFAYYPFELPLRHEQDPAPAIQIIRDIGAELRHDPALGPFILDDIEVYGLERPTQTFVPLKGRIKTLPTKQWVVGRELNRRILNGFNAAGIALTPSPTEVRLDPPTREEIKALIRDVLQENSNQPVRRV